MTAEKTQLCAQGYRWKLDEYLYLPAEESEDLGGGESLSAMTHKSSDVYRRTTAMPATKVVIMIKLRQMEKNVLPILAAIMEIQVWQSARLTQARRQRA